MLENNGSIQPIGNSMYISDLDYSWKKKSLVLNATPRGNSYNLVQLKPSSGKKKFCIKEEVPKSKDSADCKANDASKLLHPSTDEVSEKASLNSESRLQNVQFLPTCPPVPPPDQPESNPGYVNVREQERQSGIKHKGSGHKSDSESDEYENEELLEQLKENTTKTKYPVYINL